MPTTIKTLGQVAPSALTETTLYTVPTATTAVVSTLSVCNRSVNPSSFRVAIAVGGGATQTKDYLYYDMSIEGYDTFAATFGVTLGAEDVVRIYAEDATLSFSLFGQENT